MSKLHKLIKPGVLYALHMFYYYCAELLINDLAVGAVGTENVVALYGAISVAVAGGFLLFPALRRLLGGGVKQKIALAAAWALNLAALAVVLTVSEPALFSVAAVLVTLTAGYIGGFVFYTIAAGLADKAYFGRMFGVSSAAAICAQFGFTKLLSAIGGGFPAQAVVLAVMISVCAALLLFACGHLPFREIRQSEAAPPVQKNMGKYLWGAFFIIAAIWAMEGVLDGVVTSLHAEQTIDVSDVPRLLHAVGLVIAGFLFDYKEGRLYAPVAMLLMIGQVITVFLFTGADGFNAALGAMYLCGAFGSVYSLAALTLSASSSQSPALWAVMGRVAKYIPNGIMSVVGGYFYTSSSNTIFTILYVVLLGALFVLFFAQDKLAVERVAPVLEPPAAPASPSLERLAADYGITNRELEVLGLLIKGMSTVEIAEAMTITDKSVRNYVSSLMSKTGASSRGKMIAMVTGQTP